jgi:fringe protein
MMPLIGGGKFESVGDKIRLPDDVTMGYVAEHLLKVPLTVIDDFHSHMEPHKLLPTDERLADAISYSYFSKDDQPISNVLCIDGGFSLDEDPTRFLSLHCKLFPNFSWCPRLLWIEKLHKFDLSSGTFEKRFGV